MRALTQVCQVLNMRRRGMLTRAAGGEFGQQNLPGTFGIDYQFINETTIDYFIEAGVNTIRLVRNRRYEFDEPSADCHRSACVLS
jgi:hypothetical protein